MVLGVVVGLLTLLYHATDSFCALCCNLGVGGEVRGACNARTQGDLACRLPEQRGA